MKAVQEEKGKEMVEEGAGEAFGKDISLEV